MEVFLRIVLKASYYVAIVFAILPVSYNNITHRFIKSKALCFYNKLLTFIVLFVLPGISISEFQQNSATRPLSDVTLNFFMIQNIVQWMSFSQLYYSIGRKVNELIEILNEGIDLMKSVNHTTKLPIRSFIWVLLKHFIVDIFFNLFLIMLILNFSTDFKNCFSCLVMLFVTANKFFSNFYLMSLHFNAFLLEKVHCKMEKVLKTIENCRSFKHDITKHQYDCICNDASDKIDEISIQYSEISHFVYKSSKLFPLAVIYSLNYSFVNLLGFWFLLFTLMKLNMINSLDTFLANRRFWYIIFYYIFSESINLYSFIQACDCMKLKVLI